MKAMFKESDQKMVKRVDGMDKKFRGILDEIKEELKGMKEGVVGVNKEIQNVTSQTDEVEKSIEYHAGKVDQVEKEEEKRARMNSDINKKLQALENKLMMLEKHDRKFILIFHGIAEERVERL